MSLNSRLCRRQIIPRLVAAFYIRQGQGKHHEASPIAVHHISIAAALRAIAHRQLNIEAREYPGNFLVYH